MRNALSSGWILAGLLLLALTLRLWPPMDLQWESLDFVEGRMMSDAAWPASQILKEIPPDQAPMKYYLLHGMLRLGRNEFLINFPSLAFDLLSMLFLFYLGRMLFDRKTALLACFFMAVSMWNIHHATLARNYPLYAFSAILSTLCLYRAAEGGKIRDWIFYGLSLAFSFYSFYPSLFVLAAQLGWFFIYHGRQRAQVKRLALSLGLFLLLAAPLMPHLITAFRYRLNFGNGLWGLQDMGEIVGAVLEHLGGLRGPIPLGFLVFVLGFIWIFCFKQQKRQALLLMLLVVVPITLYAICFYLFRMCIVPRLFFHVYPFFLLLAAAGIVSWRHGAVRAAAILVFMLPLCAYMLHQKDIFKKALFPSDYERQGMDFSSVALAIKEEYEKTPLDYVAVAPWPSLFFIQYYLDKPNKAPVIRYLKNHSKELYTAYANPKVTIYGVDGYLSLLKPLAEAGKLLVVDVVSGNLSTLPGGAATVDWLRAHAVRTEHKAGADFYFLQPRGAADDDTRASAAIARSKLLQGSSMARQSSFWDKRGPEG